MFYQVSNCWERKNEPVKLLSALCCVFKLTQGPYSAHIDAVMVYCSAVSATLPPATMKQTTILARNHCSPDTKKSASSARIAEPPIQLWQYQPSAIYDRTNSLQVLRWITSHTIHHTLFKYRGKNRVKIPKLKKFYRSNCIDMPFRV